VRYSPDGVVVGTLKDGAAVVVLEGPVKVGDDVWYHVLSIEERLEGWVSAKYVAPVSTLVP
jgi:hypothetical protein